MSDKAKILVVDDDHGVLFSLKSVLTRDGHEVVAVDSGEAALECIAAQQFDLALIDLKLRGIGGMEVLAALRQQSPDTAAIILTAHASLETAVQALRQGAHDYLFKPCTTTELRESVQTGLLKRGQPPQRTALDQDQPAPVSPARAAGETQPAAAAPEHTAAAPAEPGRFLQAKGLLVDLARHVVTLDGCLLELSPTEFAILACLVREGPRVVPAQELVQEAQGYESEPWEARDLVRFHIHRIRQKAKAAGGRTNIIQTVRGVGYTIGE